MPVLKTVRLWLREMRPEDSDALAAVLSDPIAMVHYPAPFSPGQVEQWIAWNEANYAQFGFGLWAVVRKDTGECIGDCGLTWQALDGPNDRHLEVGWHICRDQWNQGYATEAGRACRDYASAALRQPHLISIIGVHNLASQAVAAKLGMTVERAALTRAGLPHVVFGMALDPPPPG